MTFQAMINKLPSPSEGWQYLKQLTAGSSSGVVGNPSKELTILGMYPKEATATFSKALAIIPLKPTENFPVVVGLAGAVLIGSLALNAVKMVKLAIQAVQNKIEKPKLLEDIKELQKSIETLRKNKKTHNPVALETLSVKELKGLKISLDQQLIKLQKKT